MTFKKREDGKYDTGRHALFTDTDKLQEKIDEYFETKCKTVPVLDAEGRQLVTSKGIPVVELNPPTVAGLSLFLGFSTRQSMYDYINRGDKFSYIIEKAVTRIEEYAEKQLTAGQATGAIFWLKNHKWSDTTKQEITGKDGTSLVPPVLNILPVKTKDE